MQRLLLAAVLAVTHTLAGCSGDDDSPGTTGDGGTVGEGRQYVFVNAKDGDAVHVYDFETLEPVTVVPVGDEPLEILATPDGATVWSIAKSGGEVTVIDADTLTVRHRIPVGARPVHSFLDPDRRRLWLGNDGSGDVSVIDLETGAEQRVLTGNGHHKMALATGGDGALRFAYVSNIADATLTVIDPGLEVVTNVPVGPAPHGMDYSHVTRRVYNCSGDEESSIEVIATDGPDAHTIVSRIPLPERCGYLHVSEDGRHAHATVRGLDSLAVVDLEAETVEMLPAGDYPDKFAVDGDVAWVVNVLTPTVTVVDLAEGVQMDSIEVGRAHVEDGRGHRFVQLFEDRLFVPNEEDDSVSVIDTSTREVIGTLEGIDGAFAIAVAGPRGGTTYPR